MIMGSTSNTLSAMEAGMVPAKPSNRAFSDRLGSLARRLWQAYWDYQARRATTMLLHALDDRMLADIGFKRSEIEPAVCGQPQDRRRLYDALWRLHVRL
jgi:uncharacterized protein YjiS (DUF1127 family)